LSPYLGAIDATLSDRVDYAMPIKAICGEAGAREALQPCGVRTQIKALALRVTMNEAVPEQPGRRWCIF